MRVDRLFGEHGIAKDSAAGRDEFEKRMERRRQAEEGKEFKEMVRGWCVGSETFRKELLAQMTEKVGAEHYGEEIRESAEQKAHRALEQELKKVGWRKEDLSRHRKGDPHKIKMALRLRRETTMTLGWIADQLQMGTKTHLSHLLYWQGKEKQRKNGKS